VFTITVPSNAGFVGVFEVIDFDFDTTDDKSVNTSDVVIFRDTIFDVVIVTEEDFVVLWVDGFSVDFVMSDVIVRNVVLDNRVVCNLTGTGVVLAGATCCNTVNNGDVTDVSVA